MLHYINLSQQILRLRLLRLSMLLWWSLLEVARSSLCGLIETLLVAHRLLISRLNLLMMMLEY